LEAVERVARAAAAHGKATGVLVPSREEFERYHALGFRLIAFGSDTSYLAGGAREALASGR
jgi:2-keto-3-deoxy-L-rhamnonate aldolase RhmA